jgi:hypothetical protein
MLNVSSGLSQNEFCCLSHYSKSAGEVYYNETASLNISSLLMPFSFIFQLQITFGINTSPLNFEKHN